LLLELRLDEVGGRSVMATVSLIVMEQNSEWPGHVGDSEHLVAVGGDEGLLERTQQRLAALRRRGERVRVAVLACGDATDVVSMARRAEVVHELLGAVTSVGFGRLVLSSGDRASVELRAELLSLAGTLSQRLDGTSATVSVRFGRAGDEKALPSRPSVHKVSRAPAPRAAAL
jgi:hypothetical protein